MHRFWSQLPTRQQRLVFALLAVVLLTGGYVGLWEPWTEARETQRAQVAHHQATLDWLVQVAPMIEEKRAEQSAVGLTDDQSLLSLTDQSARAAGLAGALSRIEPVNAREVNVWLDGAGFDDVMGWLGRLSMEHGVRVDRLSVTRNQNAETIDARIALAVSP